MKFLVVDDEIAFGTLLRLRLERLGHEAVVATNGAEALEMLTDEIDAVFTDVDMPIMGGVELARHLRAARADLPIVLATGSQPMGEVALEASAASSLGQVLCKDWSLERVRRTVEALQTDEPLGVLIDQLITQDLGIDA